MKQESYFIVMNKQKYVVNNERSMHLYNISLLPDLVFIHRMQFSNDEGSPLPVSYDQIDTKVSLFVCPCIVKNDITQHIKLQSCCRDTEARTSHIKPNHHGTQMGAGIRLT